MAELDVSQFLPMFKAEALDRLQRATAGMLALERNPAAPGTLDECRREVHTIKGAAGMVQRADIARRAHALEDLLTGLGQGKHVLTPELAQQILNELEQLRGLVDAIDLPSVPAPLADAGGAGTDDLWRIPRQRIEHLLTLAMELEANQARVRLWGQELEQEVRRLREFRQGLAQVMEELHVHAPLLEGLEPVVARVADYDREAERLRGRLRVLLETFKGTQASHETILSGLGQEARALRLLPCATIFDGLPRLVRDLAVAQGKQVELMVHGADVGVDRRIVEELKSCVIHLVRNSVDHGLEPPDERAQAGKPPQGAIRLTARHHGHLLLIEVGDDGRGVQPALVARAAVARGLLTQVQAQRLSESQLVQLIFTPGFSTAERVTEISGRGVGMDAVQRMIERLQGNLTLASRAGAGTLVTLSLPLTVGLVPTLVLQSLRRSFAVPLGAVEGSLVLSPGTLEPGPAPTLRWHGQRLPVVHTGQLWTSAPTLPVQEGSAVVVRSQGQVFALTADQILGEREFCLQPLGPYVGPVPFINGVGVLDEGDVALMLDVTQCVRAAYQGG